MSHVFLSSFPFQTMRSSLTRVGQITLITVVAAGALGSEVLGRRTGTLIPFTESVLSTSEPCTACHGDFSLNENGRVTLNGLPGSFTPGQTYSLSLSVEGGIGSAIGTQIVAVHDDGSASGSLSPVTGNLTSHTYSQSPVPILVHSSPLSSRTINFNWTAPASSNGRVTFKFAANSANNNFNTGGDLILYNTATTQPEAQVEDSPSLFFAQVVNGLAGGTQNQSRIVLQNAGPLASSGEVRFRDQAGQLTQFPVNGVLESSVSFSLQPWGAMDLVTDGTGDLQVGSAEVLVTSGSDSDIEGTAIFSLLGNFVSVPGSSGERSRQVFASMNSAERTGLALHNTDRDGSTTVQLILLDGEGTVQATRNLTLQPGQQLARFLDETELFEAYFTANPGDFQGSVSVRVTSGEDVAIVGLIQRLSSGALIAVAGSSDAFAPAP